MSYEDLIAFGSQSQENAAVRDAAEVLVGLLLQGLHTENPVDATDGAEAMTQFSQLCKRVALLGQKLVEEDVRERVRDYLTGDDDPFRPFRSAADAGAEEAENPN